ncbi:MAG: ParB/RepB/Spo0J family partition protein [Dehalococcoidia bacterium]
MEKKNKLGKGLGALISSNQSDELNDQISKIKITAVSPNPAQPRKNFNEDDIQELAESIKNHGVLQPIIIRNNPNNQNEYLLIAGERRLRASKIAGLDKIPAIIKKIDDQENVELAIIENIQRKNLSALEEAAAYKQLADEYNLIQEDIAQKVGKSRSAIANAIRLLELPNEIQLMLQEEKLSVGHAKLLLTIDSSKQIFFAKLVIDKNLSVRDLENNIKNMSVKATQKDVTIKQDPDVKIIEEELIKIFGTSVKINLNKKNSGTVKINFHSIDEFEGILEKLKYEKGN